MSEASLADDQQQHVSSSSTTSAPAHSGASATGKSESMDSIEYSHNQYSSGHYTNSHSNGHPSKTSSSSSLSFRGPLQSSVATLSSGQYQLTVATFHKRNQDTNSFRTGQQFLIKLDLKSVSNEPFKTPMSLILPRKMIQGHQKARQADSTTAAVASAANTTTDSASTGASLNQDLQSNQSQDVRSPLTGDPESHFYLEVTVHLASSEAIVQACPECCHKVEGKVRKPSNGPGAPLKAGANDNVDPGQILQFCVADHVVDFTHGTSTVMAKVLCSSTHHDKRGNNDRYFFKFSLMQYLNGQKIHVGSCRTKDILFTGNHKNKSMASFSEDKAEAKPRTNRAEEELGVSAPPAMVMGQSFYSEEPDSIPDEPLDKYGHAQPYNAGTRPQHASQHPSYSSHSNSPRHYTADHLPRIYEPPSTGVEAVRQRHHTLDKEPYSSQESRSPLMGHGPGPTYKGPSQGHAASMAEPRLGPHTGYAPVKAKSWNDSFMAPKISRIIPDAGDMLGGTEITVFGSGFRSTNR
ncbi:hypothetical protein BC939DRAFT_284895 [Gamsiella multidivaricata]|uniref:uncharacterized protein n=1 Tax=Gamsiella multidivaricata TaxID=101098 RepID=UPI002220E22F|nr:uncharacterized protein BC939DRAFT_284895 [Gamsiella multidivaricata]KAI7830520.1 hypothetical protein BC939DRAFT_284895 [Gamsiella multidivaricata]